MFQVQLTNFRCFAEANPVEVKPITILVGENSAGKTTFMAGARQLLESFVRSPQNPFNRDPYFLGGYDEIAHYRGGSPGRAKTFSLKISIPGGIDPKTEKQITAASHKFTFQKGSAQPDLSKYEFATPEICVTLEIKEKIVVYIERSGAESVSFEALQSPPTNMIRKDLSYLRYIFDEFAFSRHRLAPTHPIMKAEGAEASLRLLVEKFKKSLPFVSRPTFASAPVRTQPSRIYIPSEIRESSEGSHVPVEMARQKISSPTDWDRMHEKLNSFGENSGLFDDIDIKTFEKKVGNPFQVLVKNKGPQMNLIDVGYGVSQALPIIYQIEQSRLNSAILLQQPEVHLHPRAQAELGSLIARASKDRPNAVYVVETHSDYLIDRLRIEIIKGSLDHRKITIIYFDKPEQVATPYNIYFSNKGELLDAPKNFRSFFLNEHARLLGV